MRYSILILILLIHSGLSFAQPISSDFDKICYCSGRETPHSVISYDNNFQLLYSLRNGLTRKQLDSLNMEYTRSQLKLLQEFNLVRQEKDIYLTNIPILDVKQSIELRGRSRQLADKIIPVIEEDIIELVSYLNESFKTQNAFSILFSYVLDGLIWDEFEQRGIIEPRDENDISVPWKGHFWMIANPRDQGYGTNTESNGNVTIFITNGVPWRFIKPLYDESELLEIILNSIEAKEKVTDQSVLDKFEMYHLFDQNGNINVPVIFESDQNKLYSLSKQIANKVCDNVLVSISLNVLAEEYDFNNTEEALIITYHEIMWDLLSNILSKGIVEKPKILIAPHSADMSDMADLIFFTVE